mgnify:CR=1 FL=1
MSEDSAVIRLGDKTIDFTMIGEKKIVEYLFHQYHQGQEDGQFILNINSIDKDEENYSAFIKTLKKFTKEIGDKPIKELIAPNYITESKLDWEKLEDILDIKKVEETFKDLQDDNIVARLSGMAEFSPKLQRLSGKSPIAQNTMPKLEEYLDTIEDDLEREIYEEAYNEIEILSPLPLTEGDTLKVVLDLISYKKEKLMKAGVNLLYWSGKPSISKTKLNVFFKAKRGKKTDTAVSLNDGSTGNLYGISEIIDAPSLYGERQDLDEKTGQMSEPYTAIGVDKELDIKRFFMNINSEIIGDITNASKIELTFEIKPKFDESNGWIYTVERTITTYTLGLTEASTLTGSERSAFAESPKYRIGSKYNTERKDEKGGDIIIDSSSLNPHIKEGSVENKNRKDIRLDLNNTFNRLAGNYYRLSRRVKELSKEVNE